MPIADWSDPDQLTCVSFLVYLFFGPKCLHKPGRLSLHPHGDDKVVAIDHASAIMVDHVKVFLARISIAMPNSVLVSHTVRARVGVKKFRGTLGPAHFLWTGAWPTT